MLEKILRFTERLIPKKLYQRAQPFYHYLLAMLGSIIYRRPSRKLFVIGVTGTKGKSSTVEFINSILQANGHKTAVASTIHFVIDKNRKPNLFKMTMPGRMFMQRFMRKAVNRGCTHMIVEMTSEGARQFRHKFIDLDMLIFTNLAPEHIESHGSFEAYKQAKLSIVRGMGGSKKKETYIVANKDDEEYNLFLRAGGDHKATYSLNNLSSYSSKPTISFIYKNQTIYSPLRGEFNVSNMLGAMVAAEQINIPLENIKKGLEAVTRIPGRLQKIENKKGFDVVIDYAHTPDSLRSLYEAYANTKKICVLGNTGGGRDKWKRSEMAKIADEYCEQIILTDEDPYDEDPQTIVREMMNSISKTNAAIIIDRRDAIRAALETAERGEVVLITGKGTDPYIMGPKGSKQEWNDAGVAREELRKLDRE